MRPCHQPFRLKIVELTSIALTALTDNVLAPSWPGFPKGVKFHPTDEEIIEHLEAKCGFPGLKPNLLIEHFISTVTDINCTHPQKLPGVKMMVLVISSLARWKRKITSCLKDESVRWNKSGKTKAVTVNGVQRGCKRIMVLYKSGRNPKKLNWVMHEYQLETKEEEVGDFVICKITYQQQNQCEKIGDESESFGVSLPEDEQDTYFNYNSLVQKLKNIQKASSGSTLDERTQDNLVCKNIEASSSFLENNPNHGNFNIGYENFPVSNLENANLVTLPDFLPFASQDSLFYSQEWRLRR